MGLKDFIKTNGIKQRALARNLGITQPYLSHILKDQAFPSLPLAIKIEEVTFGRVPISYWIEKIKNKAEDTDTKTPSK